MKWSVIAADNEKRLFVLKADSTRKYSVILVPENTSLIIHHKVFGDFEKTGFRPLEISSGHTFMVEVILANIGMVQALKTTLSNGIPSRMKSVNDRNSGLCCK